MLPQSLSLVQETEFKDKERVERTVEQLVQEEGFFPTELLNESCNSAEDCVFDDVVRKCYIEVPWSNRTNFCECSNYYGFLGPNCDEPTANSTFIVAMFWIFTLWLSFSLLCFFRTLYLILKLFFKKPLVKTVISRNHSLNSKKKRKSAKQVPKTVIFTSLALFSGYLMLILYSVLPLATLTGAKPFILQNFTVNGEEVADVTTMYGDISTAARGIAVLMFVIASLQISVSWLEVAESMKMFNIFSDPKWNRRVKLFKRLVQFSTILFLVLLIGLVAAGVFYILLLVSSLFIMLMMILFIIGRRRFIAVLSNVSMSIREGGKDSDVYRRPLFLVRRSSLLVMTLIPLGILCMVADFFLVSSYETAVPLGEINSQFIVASFATGLGTSLFNVIHWYVHQLLKVRSKSLGRKRKELKKQDLSARILNTDTVDTIGEAEQKDALPSSLPPVTMKPKLISKLKGLSISAEFFLGKIRRNSSSVFGSILRTPSINQAVETTADDPINVSRKVELKEEELEVTL